MRQSIGMEDSQRAAFQMHTVRCTQKHSARAAVTATATAFAIPAALFPDCYQTQARGDSHG